MEIRTLVPGDAEAMFALRLRGLQESPDAFGSTYEESAKSSVEDIRKWCEVTDLQFIFGAFDGDALVGIVGFHRDKRVKGRHTSSVWGMYVAPEARGAGAGRLLIRALIARARKMPGLEQVHLDVIGGAGAARNLYLSEGFEVVFAERKALKVGEAYHDCEHLVLWL